jgi:hypothetical protein
VEEGGRGGSAVVEEVSVARGEGEAVNLWLKWDGRRIRGSWAAGRRGRREHEGARWHGTPRQRRKRGRGGSAQRVGKDKREGGPVALHRMEEESVGWPVRHLPHEAGERVAHVGYA